MSNKGIFYDANFAINEHRGMGKYINNFVSALKQEIIEAPVGLLRGGVKMKGQYKSFGFSNYILWEQLSLPLFLRKKGKIAIFPYNTAPIWFASKKNSVLILHDLIFMEMFEARTLKQKIGALYRKLVVPRVINKFNTIVTVSEYSKQEIINKFNIPASKIAVIYNCTDYVPQDAYTSNELSSRENFIFHIGGEPEYKNSKAVIYAFSMLPSEVRDNYRLKIVGIRSKEDRRNYKSILETLCITDRVDLLEYQSDEQIAHLYEKAKLFILPSLLEGFGIPIIEAFKYGCPLLCSNSSCLPEVAGNAALYFDPRDIPSICEAIIKLIKDDEVSKKIVVAGYDRLQKFSKTKFDEEVRKWYHQNF